MNHPTGTLTPQVLTQPAAARAPRPRVPVDGMAGCSIEKQRVFDADALLDRCMGNVDLAKRLLVAFPAAVDSAVCDVRTAVQHEDWQAVAAVAHRLKGAAANLAAVQIASIAGRIETAARSGAWSDLPSLLEHLVQAQPEFSEVAAEFTKSGAVAEAGRRPGGSLKLRRRSR